MDGHIESPAAFICLVMPLVYFIALSIHLTFCTAEDSINENRHKTSDISDTNDTTDTNLVRKSLLLYTSSLVI
jgi:hypothetical protein